MLIQLSSQEIKVIYHSLLINKAPMFEQELIEYVLKKLAPYIDDIDNILIG